MPKRKRVPVTATESHAEKPLKCTQKIISNYHTLLKRKNASSNPMEISSIDAEIEKIGGLNTYQKASLKGGRYELIFLKKK